MNILSSRIKTLIRGVNGVGNEYCGLEKIIMRDPKRIDKFCEELKKSWHRLPDWRFGQLMYNFISELDRDPFHIEDDDMSNRINEYTKKYSGKK